MTDEERHAKKKENAAQWYLKNKGKVNAASRAWREANPLRTKENMARWHRKHSTERNARMSVYDRKRKYKIDAEEQARLLAKGCGICGGVATHIDHCHNTNKVRGGLCRLCNIGLGHFKDDPERLRAAIRYLTKEMCT